tara:strand:- start:757 stop:2133 length:1377 start_codon:yes stop_codon:yes gene_type:complete
MTQFYTYVLTILCLLSASEANAFDNGRTPPDSTTSVVDKAAAAYFIEEGKTFFSKGLMKNALIKFREATNKDANSWKAIYWVGQCHYELNNYGYALTYAKTALKMNPEKINKEIYVLLGESHHRVGNIDSALANYELALENLSKSRAKVLLVEHHIKECQFALEQKKSPEKYKKVRLQGDVNSGFDDYGAIIRDSGKTVYFISRRSNTTGGGMNPDDQRFFEDTYKATWSEEDEEWGDATNQIGKINSNGFDAINYISPDGQSGVMTLNTTTLDISKTTKGSDIAEVKMSNKGTWNSPKIIKNKSINTSFFEGSATLTSDGNTMYFVTDRKGEKSSTDIYMVLRNGKSWGTATPLPMHVNTEGRETTPCVTPDGRFLFYSSDGLTGMGGLDVYVVENLGDSWGEPLNLGAGINSVNNDTHFYYSPELNKAFISGYEIVRKKASIDIYEIDMTGFNLTK